MADTWEKNWLLMTDSWEWLTMNEQTDKRWEMETHRTYKHNPLRTEPTNVKEQMSALLSLLGFPDLQEFLEVQSDHKIC